MYLTYVKFKLMILFYGRILFNFIKSITLDDNGVGRKVTLPISLSSSANMPGFSVYSFTLTTGRG